jgi:hypothetical protein
MQTLLPGFHFDSSGNKVTLGTGTRSRRLPERNPHIDSFQAKGEKYGNRGQETSSYFETSTSLRCRASSLTCGGCKMVS